MKSHRGLSSVIGAVFLIAIVIGALSYITYGLETMGNFSEALITEESRLKDKQSEAFEITSIDITSANKLDGVIKNTGQIPVKVTTLYIDEQGVNDVVQKFILDKAIAPGSTANLLDLVDFTIDPTKGYNLKVVTSRGEVTLLYINSPSVEPLYLNLMAIPKTVSTDFAATLLFSVVNNMSNNNNLYNLTPEISVTSANGLASASYITGPSPASYPVLAPGDVATFEYAYSVAGNEGDFVDFGLSLVNGYEISPGYNQAVNTTIVIEIVQIALKAGSALTSFGLESFENQELNLLLLHDETYNTPAAITSYQMDGSAPVGVGSTFDTYNDVPIIFFTSNATQQLTLTAPSNWNASLQYYSNFTDSSLTPPDFAFFFECGPGCSDGDSDKFGEATGNLHSIADGKGGLKQDGDFLPTWRDPAVVTDGPDGDGYWSFIDNTGFLKDDWKMENDATYSEPGAPPDTEAVWVRIPTSGIDDYMPLIYYGDTNEGMNPMDRYAITIGTAEGATADKGKISFFYSTDTGPPHSVTTTCTTSNAYDNGNWQHIVAVRESNGDCNVYINGTLVAGPVSGSTGTNTIDLKKVGIGTFEQGKDASNDLLADVASWLHWNNKALTQAEAQNLFYTNYGDNGTRVWISLNITDGNGGSSCPSCEVLIDDKEYILPFHDPSVNSISKYFFRDYLESNSDSYLKYSQKNVTVILSGTDRTLDTTNRLSFSIRMDDTEHNLPINIRFGDANFPATTIDDTNSYLQTGEIIPNWPTYLSFAVSEQVELEIFNEGPEGLWFQFAGTRMVLTTIDGVNSYGAMPEEIKVNEGDWEAIDETRDGPYIADQATGKVRFYALTDPPHIPPSQGGPPVPVVPGEYNAAIYLSGYDDTGEAFLRSIKLGTVQIIAD